MINHDYPAWHNGVYCTVQDLSISVTDFGLLRSYGIYDVVSAIDNRAVMLEQHVERFLSGCKHYLIKINWTSEQLISIIKTLNQQLPGNKHIWLVITRGEPTSYDIKDVLNASPQLMLITSPYTPVNHGQPLKLGLAKKVRRIPDWAIDQRFKNFARQDFTMAQIETSLRGFDFPLLLDHNDFITEGPQFSVAIVKDQAVLSPCHNRLSGITMQLVQQLCADQGIDFDYGNITEADIYTASDMFATTTAGGILRVLSFEQKQFEESHTQQVIRKAYQQAWYQDQWSVAV